MYKYTEVYRKLTYETATVIFLKKDGTVRIMLATRNINTSNLKYEFLGYELGGHDNRCDISNGNIAVIDLIIGEARSFNIGRVLKIYYHGVVSNQDEFEVAYAKHTVCEEEYTKSEPMKLVMEMLD